MSNFSKKKKKKSLKLPIISRFRNTAHNCLMLFVPNRLLMFNDEAQQSLQMPKADIRTIQETQINPLELHHILKLVE